MDAHVLSLQGSQQDLIYATSQGNIESLKDFHRHGNDLTLFQNEQDTNNTLLHYAIKDGKQEVIEFLLLLGMNIDLKNKFGETALHLCSGQNKNLELAKFLIMKGANP